MNKNYFRSCVFLLFILSCGFVQAAYVTVNDATGNTSRTKALNLDAKFSNNYDQYATNPWDHSGTKYFHASVKAATAVSGTKDWYSFSVSKSNVNTFLDIDFAKGDLWSWVGLFDSFGTRIAFNGVGEIFDPGSKYPWDSFLFLTLTKPGQYYVAVGRDNNQPLLAGQGYTLHIGVGEQKYFPQKGIQSEVPLPAGMWLFGSALASMGLGLSRKRA